jgi:hypothetical protein
MSEIVLGMWTSHGPTLSTTPEQWALRLPFDLKRKHPFRGQVFSYDELVKLREGEDLAWQSSLDQRTARHDRCNDAIAAMADLFAKVQPDAAIIFGNDQRELFLEDLTPAITVFTGETMWDEPATEAQAAKMSPGIHAAEHGHSPPEYREYPAHKDLAHHLSRAVVCEGFDIAVSNSLPKQPDHWHSGTPHSCGFIYRRIMRDKVIPNVPIFVNTFFPPNQPTARRCFEFGRAVGLAVRSWKGGERVAVFGSGGMSHFVIDEDFDRMFFNAISQRDGEALCAIDECHLQSGTSELKTWIMAAGALFDTDLDGGVVGYEPCYRSEAGTGTANGFVAWS